MKEKHTLSREMAFVNEQKYKDGTIKGFFLPKRAGQNLKFNTFIVLYGDYENPTTSAIDVARIVSVEQIMVAKSAFDKLLYFVNGQEKSRSEMQEYFNLAGYEVGIKQGQFTEYVFIRFEKIFLQ